MTESSDVIITYEGEIVRITLNRPAQLNALNESVRAKIAATLNDLMERPDIRLLVLSGEGKSFCSGADLTTSSYPKVEGSWSTRRNRTATWQRVLELAETRSISASPITRAESEFLGLQYTGVAVRCSSFAT